MTSYAYIKLSTLEYPRFQGDIRLEHPEIGVVFVCPDTYAEVYDPEIMFVSGENEIIIEGQPVQINGKWVRQLTLMPYVNTTPIKRPKFINGTAINYPFETTEPPATSQTPND